MHTGHVTDTPKRNHTLQQRWRRSWHRIAHTLFHLRLELPPDQGVERRGVPALPALLQPLPSAGQLPEPVQALDTIPLRLALLLSPP